jgi:hypothetical protein
MSPASESGAVRTGHPSALQNRCASEAQIDIAVAFRDLDLVGPHLTDPYQSAAIITSCGAVVRIEIERSGGRNPSVSELFRRQDNAKTGSPRCSQQQQATSPNSLAAKLPRLLARTGQAQRPWG